MVRWKFTHWLWSLDQSLFATSARSSLCCLPGTTSQGWEYTNGINTATRLVIMNLKRRWISVPYTFLREAYRHCGSRVSSVEVDPVIHRHPFTFACITVPAEQAVQHRSAVFRHTRVQRGACRVLWHDDQLPGQGSGNLLRLSLEEDLNQRYGAAQWS